MARPMKPLVRGGGFYPSRKWTPLVYAGGYTTANGGEEPAPPPIEKTIIGNPIHILDALAKPAQALSIALEPIQGLHGYDAPWPAGGGKNLYPGGVRYHGQDSIANVTSGANYMISAEKPDTNNHQYNYAYLKSDNSWEAQGGLIGSNVTRNSIPVTIPSDVIGINIYDVNSPLSSDIKIQIELGSTATSWTPYSNICPISGHTGAEIEQRGKNLFNPTAMRYSQGGGLTITTENTKLNWVDAVKYTITGTNTGWGWRVIVDGIKNAIKPDTDYCMSYVMDGHALTSMNISQSSGASSLIQTPRAATTRTLPNGLIQVSIPFHTKPADDSAWASGGIVLLLYSVEAIQGVTCTFTLTKPQLSFGLEVPDSVDQYQGNTLSVTFPSEAGTVYGGTLDVTNGVLTVDRALWTASAGNLARSNDNAFYSTAISNIKYSQTQNTTDVISNKFKAGVENNQDTCFINTNGRIRLNTSTSYSTVADMLADIGEITVVYPLATPITIQLTPTQVELLQGENNIWSDGEMTLVYLADGNASDEEALNILLGGRYVNNHGEDEPTDREALNIILGGNER